MVEVPSRAGNETLRTNFMGEWIVKRLRNGRISPRLAIAREILYGEGLPLFINPQDILEPIIRRNLQL